MVSPLNGAQAPMLQKGQTANPKGSSLKARARQALARILDDPSLEAAFRRLAKIAAEADDDSDAVAAIKLIADTAGLKVADVDRVTVQTVIELKDRRNGSKPRPMLATQIESEAPKMLGSGGKTDIPVD